MRSLLIALLACCGLACAQWTPLNSAPAGIQTCLLLTNGDVMCHQGATNVWHRLTPDIHGSYANGTWDSSPIARMPDGSDTSNNAGNTCSPCTYAPTYFASAVLADGRVVVVGGEFNTNGAIWTNIGFLYDPVADTWSAQLTVPFPAGHVGDSQSVVLENGTMLIANLNDGNVAAFNPSTLTFAALNPPGKLDANSEAGWTMLPDGRVLSADAGLVNSSEIYNPATNTWGSAGTTAGVNLTSEGGNCSTREVGPAVARPDGTVIQFTANSSGKNAVYNIGAGTWSHNAGMDFPIINGRPFGTADAPASLLPNGNVLVQASPVDCHIDPMTGNFTMFDKPSHFFEWDGANITQVSDAAGASSMIAFFGRMLLLPTGEVLLTGAPTTQIYSNGGAPQNAWRPAIDSAPAVLVPGATYSISGRQFNGFSEGATYGDDAQMATNYPLVRIKNTASGHVFYARTHGHSRMGIEAVGSATVVTTNFDTPSGLELGAGTLVVVTNGIPSLPVNIAVVGPPSISKTFASASVLLNTKTAVIFTLTNPAGNAAALTGVSFADNFPAGIMISNLTPLSNTCGVVPVVTHWSLTVSGVTLGVGAACTISLEVTGMMVGTWTNTVAASSANAGTGAPSSAALTVYSTTMPPAIAKAFSSDVVAPGGTVTLTITITNPNALTVTGVGFTDTLPAGLTVAAPAVNTCGGTASAAGSIIQLTNGTLAAHAACTVKVLIQAANTGPQRICNTTSPVTSIQAGTGYPAFACLTIGTSAIAPPDAYQLSYASNVLIGDSFVNLSNAGTLSGNDPDGDICVNVYAFDPSEEMASCCSCLVTPNGLNALSARQDLISKTLTPAKPSGIVIKLLASHPVAGACNPSSPNAQNLVPGVRAWNSTLHAHQSQQGSYAVAELSFKIAVLSPSELSKLTTFCGFIQANGSTFGICGSCRLGGNLGGAIR